MAGGGAGARCPSFSVRAARQPQACDGGMVALRLHAADLALMLLRLSQGYARDFSCTRPSSSIDPHSKVGYGLGDVRDGGAAPRDLADDAGERRRSIGAEWRGTACRQSAAVGVETCTRDESEGHLSGCLLSLCCVHWDACPSKGHTEIPPRSRSGVYDTATITFGRAQMRLCPLRARKFLGELILSD